MLLRRFMIMYSFRAERHALPLLLSMGETRGTGSPAGSNASGDDPERRHRREILHAVPAEQSIRVLLTASSANDETSLASPEYIRTSSTKSNTSEKHIICAICRIWDIGLRMKCAEKRMSGQTAIQSMFSGGRRSSTSGKKSGSSRCSASTNSVQKQAPYSWMSASR